jgi:CubicO group peptidase (beta-lactamase class C family)
MSRFRKTLIFTIGLAFALCNLAAQADSGALKPKVDAVIDQAIAENRIVGTVVLIAQDGKIVYQRAAGFADKQSGKPMQVDTLFRLASVTKPIVTVAALALVDRKVLSLDDPVTKWLPDFKPKLADGTTPTITVRQLLTHTSGLGYKFTEQPDGPYHQAQVSDGLDNIKINLAEEVRRLGGVPLLNAPGSEWRYSLSMDVLGAVIESAAKKPLGKAVADLVTKPLGMKGTTFVVDGKSAGRLAIAYYNAPSGVAPMTDPQDVPLGPMTLVFSPSRAFDPRACPSGGGGMNGSAPDALRFFEAIRKGGKPVLEESTAGEMFRNQVAGLPGLPPFLGFGYGGGVLLDPAAAKSPESAGTLSWGGVYGHSWFIDRAKKLTVVSFTNTSPDGMAGKFPDGVRDAVYEALQ